MKLFALHLKLVKYIQQQCEGPMLIRRKIQGVTLQNHYDTIHWSLMQKLLRYHIIIHILTGPILGKLLPSYGAIDCSRKKQDHRRPNSYVGQWFLCLHIDGVVLTAPDTKINTGKISFRKKTPT